MIPAPLSPWACQNQGLGHLSQNLFLLKRNKPFPVGSTGTKIAYPKLSWFRGIFTVEVIRFHQIIHFLALHYFLICFGLISLLLSDGSFHGVWNTPIIWHLAALLFTMREFFRVAYYSSLDPIQPTQCTDSDGTQVTVNQLLHSESSILNAS